MSGICRFSLADLWVFTTLFEAFSCFDFCQRNLVKNVNLWQISQFFCTTKCTLRGASLWNFFLERVNVKKKRHFLCRFLKARLSLAKKWYIFVQQPFVRPYFRDNLLYIALDYWWWLGFLCKVELRGASKIMDLATKSAQKGSANRRQDYILKCGKFYPTILLSHTIYCVYCIHKCTIK